MRPRLHEYVLRPLRAALCACALSLACPAPAQLTRPIIPGPGETDPNQGFVATVNALGYFSLFDGLKQRQLIAPSLPLFYDTPLQPVVTCTATGTGADITLVYTNTLPTPARLGTIGITGIQFPLGMRFYRFGQDTRAIPFDTYSKQANDTYPGGVYCPVSVVADSQHTLGISLHYPAVLYDQQVVKFVVPHAPAPGAPPNDFRPWAAGFRLETDLPPGGTRTYTLSIRAVRAGGNWLFAALPYRDYFQRTYGPVKYTRDRRPVFGQGLAFLEYVSPSNPRGYTGGNLRPDLNGWGPWVQHIRTTSIKSNLQRVMLWTPSGVFDNSHLNFPFQFMTGLADLPLAWSTLSQLSQVSANGGPALGVWWGHSLSVMEQWNPTTGHNLNPYNPADVARGFAELDAAAVAGATMVGLDAFKMPRPGAQYFWLRQMQLRHPQMRFIQENAASDIFHNLSPTFHEAHSIATPHVMADLLNPGHETWAAITALPVGGRRNYIPLEGDAEVQRIADLGFVPLTYGVPVGDLREAAASWEATIPPEIRATDLSLTMTPQEAQRTGPQLPAALAERALANRPVLAPR